MAGGAAGAPMSPQGQPLAEWWKRAVAAIIDGVIVGVPAQIIGGLIFGGLFAVSAPSIDPVTGQVVGGSTGFFASFFASWGAFILTYWVITGAYYTFLHSSRGQTVGKMILKLKVVDEATGSLIPIGRALIRWLIPIPLGFVTCGIVFLLDGLWPLWDVKRQALHDKIAKTLVVDMA
jgi:uncharacterized RDD family membrane protein YckC